MEIFDYKNSILHMEQVSLATIANTYQTPCYVYSSGLIKDKMQSYQAGFGEYDHLVCYSVKANSNLAILRLLKEQGSGFDIVSGGELERLLAINVDPDLIVFSGVGKTRSEISRALDVGISCFNVESEQELARIDIIAQEKNTQAPIALRINPNVDGKTHPYIATGLKENKFGINADKALDLYLKAANSNNLKIVGIDCHIGSQLTDMAPFTDTVKLLLDLADILYAKGIELDHIDVGGGLGVAYHDETPPTPAAFSEKIKNLIGNKVKKIIIEPGRSIIANAGVFLTKVEYLKHSPDKNFCVVDGAMNDLIRPSLYSVWHKILQVNNEQKKPKTYDVVGPVCETGDFLGKDRELAVKQGDILAIMDCGAYGFVMASNYNSRPRAAEVLVDKNTHKLVRPRESVADLFVTELNSL